MSKKMLLRRRAGLRLERFRAVWHGHVVAAASVHWAAVLVGVVLTTG